MVRSDLNGLCLELEKRVSEITGNGKLRDAGLSFARQVVRHLQIDEVGRDWLFARPAFVDDFRQLGGDVQTEGVLPTVLEPLLELQTGVVVEYIQVELALLRQARHCEVAATEEPRDGVVDVVAVMQVELRMEGVSEEQLNYELAGLELGAKAAKGCFVAICGSTEGQLAAKRFRHARAELCRSPVVDGVIAFGKTKGTAEVFLVGRLHSDEQPALFARATVPSFHVRVERLPTPQVEVTNTVVGVGGSAKRFLECAHQMGRNDVVEDSWQGALDS